MAAPKPTDIFKPGDLLNNTYRIEGVLGRGGISEVYRARSEISGRVVALKVLNREFAKNEAFLVLMTREEQIRDVRHDAVVRYSENQRTPDGHVYLVMDYVEGVALDSKLDDGGLPMRDLLTIGARVAAGLEVAHSHQIVHRDLSPDNIILRAGDPGQAVIIDFGIAKDASPGASTIVGGKFAGKYAYAAPEQFRGNADGRSDIYSLGALLLAVYRGAEPEVSEFPADVIEYKKTPLNTEGVPPLLRGILDKMCAPDPDARYQTASELREAFEAALGSLTVVQTVIPDETTPAPRRSPVGLILAILVVVILGVGAGGIAALRMGALSPSAIPPGLAALIPDALVPRATFYPEVAPFTFAASRTPDSPPRASGHVPSPELADRLSALISGSGGLAELSLARGSIPPDWGRAVEIAVAGAMPLESWDLKVEDSRLLLQGLAPDAATRDRVIAALALPDSMESTLDIALPVQLLTEADVAPALDAQATCGPLNLASFPAGGLPDGEPLKVTGNVRDDGHRLALREALLGVAGNHPIALQVEELNPALCLVLRKLAEVPESEVEFVYSFGRTGQVNDSDKFFAGETAVIDLILPADLTSGYLYLAAVDATGEVGRMIPNPFRQRNAVQDLREGKSGQVPVRISYTPDEARGTNRLILTINDSSPGKGMLVLLHTDAPILPEPARRDETVQAYAAALEAAVNSPSGRVLGQKTRLLISDVN